MKKILVFLLFIMLVLSTSAHATLSGDVTGGGNFSNQVATDNGWIIESAAANGVDFWTLNANAGDTVSIDISSVIDFGISVYFGSVMDDLGFAFNNNADFTDPLSGQLGTYIGGTNGDFGVAGSLLSLILPNAGIHTIAVGGDLGFGASGPFNYDMNVNIVSVPETATLLLLLSGLLALYFTRQKMEP